MPGTPESLLETPRAAAADLLSEVLATVRLAGAILFRAELREPFAVAIPPAAELARGLGLGPGRIVPFHLVVTGRCTIEAGEGGGERVELVAGDAICLPYGDAHAVRRGVAPAVPAPALMPPPPFRDVPALVHGGAGASTQIICGFVGCDDTLFDPFLRGLPALLHSHPSADPADEWLRTTIRYTAHEATSRDPGARCILGRLTELMFVETLRHHMGRRPAGELGWLAALGDPVVGAALRHLHEAPGAAWTVDALARQVGVSRTVLAERFAALLDQPPMTYLTRWRMQRAAQLLRSTSAPVKEIAARTGYETEAAFNRAFKRALGLPPATWRRRQGA